jgi:colanic acid/amylovoran biosynthesis glycosyltransferase
MFKSLAIVPKSLWFAESLAKWGADHVHGEFAGHPATTAWIIGRLKGIPFSFSCRAHDIFITQALLEEKVEESAFVRAVSSFNIEFLSKHVRAFDPDKAHVIHSSIDLHETRATPIERGEVFRVLYVGSLEQRKGVDDLLHALCKLKGSWNCQIIGDGSMRAYLESLSHKLELQDRVAFLGAKQFQEVSEAYRESDVVAAPSKIGRQGRTEGIPNVVIEALGHGRPVITSRVSGIPELVRDGETGLLIEPGDIDGLAAALKRIKNDPELGERLAAEGRKAVEADFDLARNAARQLSLFEQYSAGANPT